MFTVFIILAGIAAVLLILAVLIQNPKGGGVAANFSAANQIAGVKKTNEFIEKATWTLAIALIILSIGSRFMYSQSTEEKNAFLERVEEANIPAVSAPTLNNDQLNSQAQPTQQEAEKALQDAGAAQESPVGNLPE